MKNTTERKKQLCFCRISTIIEVKLYVQVVYKKTTNPLYQCPNKKNTLVNLLLCHYFPGVVTVGELLRNKTAFVLDVQQHMDFDPAALHLLMETMQPNNNLEVSQGHPYIHC